MTGKKLILFILISMTASFVMVKGFKTVAIDPQIQEQKHKTKFINEIPDSAEVISEDGRFISFKYMEQCFLSTGLGTRVAALAKIDC